MPNNYKTKRRISPPKCFTDFPLFLPGHEVADDIEDFGYACRDDVFDAIPNIGPSGYIDDGEHQIGDEEAKHEPSADGGPLLERANANRIGDGAYAGEDADYDDQDVDYRGDPSACANVRDARFEEVHDTDDIPSGADQK